MSVCSCGVCIQEHIFICSSSVPSVCHIPVMECRLSRLQYRDKTPLRVPPRLPPPLPPPPPPVLPPSPRPPSSSALSTTPLHVGLPPSESEPGDKPKLLPLPMLPELLPGSGTPPSEPCWVRIGIQTTAPAKVRARITQVDGKRELAEEEDVGWA